MRLGRHTVYRGLHVKADFKLDRDGFRKIALSAPVRKAVHNIVRYHARPQAEALAAEFSDSGTYMRSFKIHDTEVVAGPKQWPMLRASAQLYNDAKHPGDAQSYATAVEVGNHLNPNGHHVLGKTLEHLVALGIVTMTPKARSALTKQLRRRPRRRQTRRPRRSG